VTVDVIDLDSGTHLSRFPLIPSCPSRLPRAQYAGSVGLGTCTACQPGRAASTQGASVCAICSAGFFATGTGNAEVPQLGHMQPGRQAGAERTNERTNEERN
jgi:hypothetical protein